MSVCSGCCVLIRICLSFFFFFCKQKTAYEMRISDWSSYVCSSDLNEQIDGRSGADTEDFARFDVGEGGFGGLAFGEVLGVHGRESEGRIRQRQASRPASERHSRRSD